MANLEGAGFEFFDFFEMTPDLVCIADRDGFFRKVNHAVIEKLGYTEKELFERPIASFIHPDDKDLTSQRRSGLLLGDALLNFENRYFKKDGNIIWLEWSSIYSSDRKLVFAIAKDITERKQIEKEVEEKYRRFKDLATHFKSSIEEDRKYLASELHEELAQLVSVVRLDIGFISNNLPDLSGPLKARIDHVQVVSELLIDTIRRISFSISPNMLDDLGLNAALNWQSNEFSVMSGIPCHFESRYDEAGLSSEIRIDFFRICQESLTDVMYHAQASNVVISIEDIDDKIVLTIAHDGKGFDTNDEKRKSVLTSMRERADSINGVLAVHSDRATGTRVSITVDKQ